MHSIISYTLNSFILLAENWSRMMKHYFLKYYFYYTKYVILIAFLQAVIVNFSVPICKLNKMDFSSFSVCNFIIYCQPRQCIIHQSLKLFTYLYLSLLNALQILRVGIQLHYKQLKNNPKLNISPTLYDCMFKIYRECEIDSFSKYFYYRLTIAGQEIQEIPEKLLFTLER